MRLVPRKNTRSPPLRSASGRCFLFALSPEQLEDQHRDTPGAPRTVQTKRVNRFRGRVTPVMRPVRLTAPMAVKPMAAETAAVPMARRIRIRRAKTRNPTTSRPVTIGSAATPSFPPPPPGKAPAAARRVPPGQPWGEGQGIPPRRPLPPPSAAGA